jgi:hypothetical protein
MPGPDGGASGNEIGRVTVRVVPDTTGFKRKVEEQLKTETAGLDEQVPVEPEVENGLLTQKVKAQAKAASGEKVTVGVETEQFDLDRFQRRMLSDLQRFMSKNETKIPLTVEGESLRRGLEAWEKRIEADIALEIPVDFGTAAAQREKIQTIIDAVEELEKAAKKPIKFDPFQFDDKALFRWDQKVQKFRQEEAESAIRYLELAIREADERLKASREEALKKVSLDPRFFAVESDLITQDEIIKIKADADFRDVEIALQRLKAQAALVKIDDLGGVDAVNKFEKRFQERPLKANVELNFKGNSFTKAVSGLSSSAFSTVAQGLGSIGSGAFSAAKGFIELGRTGIIVVGVLALIAPALALVSGALVTLPAIMAAVLFPIGAIALGLDGIKKAATDAGLFEDSNGGKKGGGKVGAALDSIKEKVNGAFEQGLKPAFESFAAILQDGAFGSALANVATGLSDMFAGVTSALEKSKGALANIGSNIGKAFSAARPGIEDFTTGLVNLVSKLSDKFPGISEAINRTGQSFLDWVDRMTAVDPSTGVSKLDTAMKQLGDTLSELGGLVSDFFNSGWENLSNVDFGSSMKGFVQSIRSLVTDTLPALSNAFQTIASALKPIAVVVDAIDKVLNRLGSASIPRIGTDQSSLETLFGKPGKWINDAINPEAAKQQALEAGKQVGDSLNQGMATAALNTNAATQQAAAVAVAAKQEFDKTIAAMPANDQESLIAAALGSDETAQAQWGAKLATAASSARDGITAQFDGVKEAVAAKWVEINAAVTTGITGMQTTISTFFTQLPLGFTGAFTGIQQSITGMFILIAQSISTQSANLSNTFATAFEGLPGRIGQALSGAPAAITGALAGVAGAVAVSMAEAAEAANQGGALTAQVAGASFGTVPPAISAAMQPCITVVATVCQQMVSTALSFAGAMEQSGVAIGASFARGIASQASLVASSANALMAAARVFFPNSPAKEGPFSGSGWVDKSGEALGEGFAMGIEDSAGGVVGVAKQMMQAVKDVFGDAAGLTLNFNFGATAMSSMAADAESFKGSMEGAAASLNTVSVPSGVGGGTSGNNFAGKVDTQTKGELDVLKYQQEYLDLQRQSLQLQTNGASKAQQAELKRQMDMLQLQKDRIGLQSKELEYWSKYQDTSRDMNDAYTAAGDKFKDSATDIAKNVGGQFMSDLGMSGSGAIPNLVDQGSQYIFQVLDVQSALTGQQVLQNKKAQQYTGGM